jgi:hypothetical protein
MLAVSKDASPERFDRQRKRRGLPSKYVHPAVVVELEGDRFIIRDSAAPVPLDCP